MAPYKKKNIFAAIILMITVLFTQNTVHSQEYKVLEEGPVNEAYLSPVGGVNLILEAIEKQPPDPINERIPVQTDALAEWVPGYWAWMSDLNDFVWFSGVWRRPPPGHLWISGFWKKFDEGWVWIHGFWNKVPESSIQYIAVSPPDSIDENIAPPPNSSYLWNPGYWQFDFATNEYKWSEGNWDEMDPNWVLTPAHYVWRPGGYVFVPALWDWPLDVRGQAFAPVRIEREYRYRAEFQPYRVLEPQAILSGFFPNYPNYMFVYHHHFHFHPDYWQNCGCTPPWWGWDTWWSLNWRDQWGLWWWYSHPGYPQPDWLTGTMSAIIAPPNQTILGIAARARPPAIITPQGVVTRRNLIDAASKVSGRFAPILPADRKMRDKIFTQVKPAKIDKEILKPTGKQLPFDPNQRRPNVRKPVIDDNSKTVPRVKDGGQLKIPPKPRNPSAQPSSPIWPGKKTPGQEIKTVPDVRRPTWTPRTKDGEDNAIYKPSEGGSPIWTPRDHYREPIRRPSVQKSQPEIRRVGDQKQNIIEKQLPVQGEIKQPQFQQPQQIKQPQIQHPQIQQPQFKQPQQIKQPQIQHPQIQQPQIQHPQIQQPQFKQPQIQQPQIQQPQFKQPQFQPPQIQPPPQVQQKQHQIPRQMQQPLPSQMKQQQAVPQVQQKQHQVQPQQQKQQQERRHDKKDD